MKGKRIKRPPLHAEVHGSQRETLAELVFLSHALTDMSLPIMLAERWFAPADLPELIERVRSLLGFVDSCLTKYSENIRQARASEDALVAEDAFVVETNMESVRQELRLFDKLRASQNHAANDFSAEADELRKLRSGELKAVFPAGRAPEARP